MYAQNMASLAVRIVPEQLRHVGKGSSAVSGQAPDRIEWCGAEYALEDLKAALAVLLPQGTPGDELMAQHYSDPWQPATWDVYSHNAVTLLKALAECQTAPQVWRQTLF